MMKTVLLLATIFMSLSIHSQSLVVKNAGKVYDMNGNKWTPKEVRDILVSNSQALDSYNKGKFKKSMGNILLYGGLAIATTDVALAFKNESPVEQTSFIPTIIGCTMALVAIPVKIGHTKKVKNAIELHNKTHNSQVQTPTTKFTIIASQNQVGLFVEF